MLGHPTPKSPRPRLALEGLDSRDVPTLIALDNAYQVAAGSVLTVDARNGILADDFSDQNFGDVLVASVSGPPVAVGTIQPLPPNTLTLNPNGSFTFIAPSNLPPNVTQVKFSYRASNLIDTTETSGFGNVTITITGARQQYLAVGSDAGVASTVNAYDIGTGNLRFTVNPYEPSFTGGVRVAVGDLNNDGVDDIVCAPGVGGGARIKIFDGKTLGVIFDDANVFSDVNFRGGAYVAIGDVDGNGRADVLVGAGEQGGPRVVIIDSASFVNGVGAPYTKIADFFAYEMSFRNGVRVAAGDLNGIGRASIVTAPGQGGGPVIHVYDYQTVTGQFRQPAPLTPGSAATAVTPTPLPVQSFFADNSANRDGVYVSTGNLRGDGKFDIITGTGAGQAVVRVFDGRNSGLVREYTVPTEEVPPGGGSLSGPSSFGLLNPPSGTLLAPTQPPASLISSTSAFSSVGVPSGVATGGVRVTAADWNRDGLDDVIAGTAPGNVSRVRVFDTTSNAQTTNFLAFPSNFLGGVNVGA